MQFWKGMIISNLLLYEFEAIVDVFVSRWVFEYEMVIGGYLYFDIDITYLIIGVSFITTSYHVK